jgi:hypothetical protein
MFFSKVDPLALMQPPSPHNMENFYPIDFFHQSEKRWRKVQCSSLSHVRDTQLQFPANRVAILQRVIAVAVSPLMDQRRDTAVLSVTRKAALGVVDGAKKINPFFSVEATKDLRKR